MANVVAKIEIVMTDDGQVNVNGPLENKILMYGLLEVAKETAAEHAKAAERLVQPAPPGSARFLASMKP